MANYSYPPNLKTIIKMHKIILQHSPRPWTFRKMTHGYWVLGRPLKDCPYGLEPPNYLFWINGPNKHPDDFWPSHKLTTQHKTPAEIWANAQLAANAPELLHALQQLINSMLDPQVDKTFAIQTADSAIYNATIPYPGPKQKQTEAYSLLFTDSKVCKYCGSKKETP